MCYCLLRFFIRFVLHKIGERVVQYLSTRVCVRALVCVNVSYAKINESNILVVFRVSKLTFAVWRDVAERDST